jgi:hypothetical protein
MQRLQKEYEKTMDDLERSRKQQIIYRSQNIWVSIPRDIFNYILELIHTRERVWEKEMIYNPIKALFITSKEIREVFYDLFMTYLSINYYKQDEFRRKYVKHIYIPTTLELKYKGNITTLDLSRTPFNVSNFFKGIPPTVEYLMLPNNFDEKIEESDLPFGLKTLIFGKDFNSFFENLPQGLEHLEFGKKFNLDFKNLGTLPHSLTFLKFGEKFNKKIPKEIFEGTPHLRTLIFGDIFNQKIDSILPKSLIHLEFGSNFNGTIEHLPSSLQVLKLGIGFNHDIKDLPDSLIIFEFKSSFRIKIYNLPPKLEIFKIRSFTSIMTTPINSLHHLELEGGDLKILDYFPSLKYLKLVIDDKKDKDINNIPNSVEILYFISTKTKITKIPKNLKMAYLYENYLHKDALVKDILEINPSAIIEFKYYN